MTIYLDHNATTPVDPRVVDALLPYLREHFGNPSSAHHYGREPAAALARAREQVGALIGTTGEHITFTGSGSEADALAIRGVAAGRHVVTQATEHPAVLAACRAVSEVTVLPVDGYGLVRPADLEQALRDDTALVTIMHANNETGVIQPIAALAAVARRRGVPFHTDAAQSVGKIPVGVGELGVDLLTLVGHKMYAPKGIAALYVGDVEVEPLIGGGGQERGLRAGTENVPYAVGLGKAAELAAEDHDLSPMRDHLQKLLEEGLPGRVTLNGHPERRLPHVLNVSVEGTRGHEVLAACPDLAASTGSACHAGRYDPSPVLTAMGFSPSRALGAVRLSLGRWTTESDIDRAAAQLVAAVKEQP